MPLDRTSTPPPVEVSVRPLLTTPRPTSPPLATPRPTSPPLPTSRPKSPPSPQDPPLMLPLPVVLGNYTNSQSPPPLNASSQAQMSQTIVEPPPPPHTDLLDQSFHPPDAIPPVHPVTAILSGTSPRPPGSRESKHFIRQRLCRA